MEKKLNLQTLIGFIYDEMEMPDIDCLRRRGGESKDKPGISNKEIFMDMIEEVLDYAEIKEGDDLSKFQDDIDFDAKRDVISERADSQVDIYNHNLWTSAVYFREETEEWIDNVGVDGCGLKERGLIGLFQAGQYNFYECTARNILDACEKYFEELEEKENEEEETK